MVEQQDRGPKVVLAAALLALGLPACAVAHAQPQPRPAPPANAARADAGAARATTADAGAATAGGSAAFVGMRPPVVGAGLTVEGVRRAVNRMHSQLMECYTRARAADPRAHTALAVRVQVIAGGTGTLDRVHTAPRNEELETCSRGVLSQVAWPNPRGVPATEINLTIDMLPTLPAPAGPARR